MGNNPDAIVGHQFQIEQLCKDLETDNVAHAYLFVGPPHVGKMTIARWFGAALLCRDTPPERCDEVQGRITNLLHPDFLVLDRLWVEGQSEDFVRIAKSSNVPQQHRCKAKVKTDSIGIDDVRLIQERLHETGEGRYRICVIRSVERMQEAAASAFLKILEEPPEGRIFLLTAGSLGHIRSTIVSRTRILRFEYVPRKEMKHLLSGMDPEEGQFLLHCSQGAPGVIMRLRSDPDALRAERLYQSKATAFWHTSLLAERCRLLDIIHQRTTESRQFLFHLALALRSSQVHNRLLAEHALRALIRGLETNTNRQLLTQQFALSVSDL